MAEIEQRRRERQWRKWQRKSGLLDRSSLSVSSPSDNAKSAAEIIGELVQPKGD
jgi:hypothetical protein